MTCTRHHSQHMYQASAYSVSAEFERPKKHSMAPQASVVLAGHGGHGSNRASAYNADGLISFKNAYSEVGGSFDDCHDKHTTHAWSVVEGLNVADMLTADRVVARMAVYHDPTDGSEATYDITGSYFENLRIAGHSVELELATHVFHDHDTYSKLAKAHQAGTTDKWLVGSKLKQLEDDKLSKLQGDYHALMGMSEVVKEWKKTERTEDRGSYWFSPANNLEWNKRFVRNSGIWLHHLYSQIRGHSSGGNGSASSFADATNVPGADVLFRARHLRWWNRIWWRYRRWHRPFCTSRLIAIIALLLVSTIGCESKRASLEKRYAEARLLFQQGYIEQPLPLAESGYRDSISYPDLNWKFRVLTAEARNRKGRFAEALEILEPEPPSDIPSEIFWRRRIAQAMSLCQLGNYPETEERFAQAAALHAEPGALNYARGRCARSQGHLKEAENFLRLVTAQSSNPDPFIKAYALGTMAALAGRDHPLR